MTEASGDLEALVLQMLASEYLKRIAVAEEELIGDLDNWRPTGFLRHGEEPS